MSVDPALRDDLLGAIPGLRAFAFSLTNNSDWADDLVQTTIMQAWANIDRFKVGTNLKAWLFTILRNAFRSEYRRRKREVEDADGFHAGKLTAHPDQQAHLDFEDFRAALGSYSGRPAGGHPARRGTRHVLRRGGGDLRRAGRHDQEPRQPGTNEVGAATGPGRPRGDRSRQHHKGCPHSGVTGSMPLGLWHAPANPAD